MEATISDNREKSTKKLDYYEQSVSDGYETNLEIKLFCDTVIRMPLGISPIVIDGVNDIDKQLEIAKGAREFNTVMILNCCSMRVAEEIVAKEPNLIKWLEVYIFKDRTVTLDLVKRAEKLDFKAIVLTIKFPSKSQEKLRQNQFEKFKNLYEIYLESNSNNENHNNIEIERLFDFANDVTWDDLEWIRLGTRLPIIVNGIQTADEARLAIYNGANAVMVSNFGEKHLLENIKVLREIAASVGKYAYVFVNQDLRTGMDVFKALSVGANAVFIREPIISSVNSRGSFGVKSILDMYYSELNAAMNLYGCTTVHEIDRVNIAHNCDNNKYVNICSKL